MRYKKIMKAFLLTYNPKIWQWGKIDKEIELVKQNGFVLTDWDCVSKKPQAGDIVFIIALGTSPRKGIFCSGCVKELCVGKPSTINTNKITNVLKVNVITLLNPARDKILDMDILGKEIPNAQWHPRGSGIEIKKNCVGRLLELWDSFLQEKQVVNHEYSNKEYFEGNLHQELTSRYERNIEARIMCIKHYGCICQVCKIDMEKKYGPVGRNFIHVHHIEFLSDKKKEHKIDPINDLVTLCPNCHSMLHRKIDRRYLSVQELTDIIKHP